TVALAHALPSLASSGMPHTLTPRMIRKPVGCLTSDGGPGPGGPRPALHYSRNVQGMPGMGTGAGGARCGGPGGGGGPAPAAGGAGRGTDAEDGMMGIKGSTERPPADGWGGKIGRASCRERGEGAGGRGTVRGGRTTRK